MFHDQSMFQDYELPRLTALAPNLIGASFFLMKLLPARFVLDQAERYGHLKPGGRICETTSGTFGLALAMLSVARGYKLTLVSDNAIDLILQQRLRDVGTQLEIVEAAPGKGGIQRARLDRLHKIMADCPGTFCPRQYENPDNPSAYAAVAEQISERVGEIDCIIGTVGSGGSMSGLSRILRMVNPDLNVIGIDTPASFVFGQPDGARALRGLGNSLMPANVDHCQFDRVHWVTAPEAYQATRELHRNHALFQGGTSGAAYLVARWWAAQNPKSNAVVIFPDEGNRYTSTIYNDTYLQSLEGWSDRLPQSPIQVDDPRAEMPVWSCFDWNRQSINDVLLEKEYAHE